MILILIIFLLVGIFILFGSHYLLYLSIIKFFSVENKKERISLLCILMFLASSFFVATLLESGNPGPYSRVLYLVSASWLGIFLQLLIASAFIWIFFYATNRIKFYYNKKIFAFLILLLGIAFGIYGLWNAQNPIIKNTDIQISNLPESWKGKKIVQLSDIHLGLVYGADFMLDVINKVNEQNPDIIVITGDYFDGNCCGLQNYALMLNQLKAQKGKYFITGNHETYIGTDTVRNALTDTDVVFLNDETVDIDGLKITGIGYPLIGENKDFGSILKKIKPEDPDILLYHEPSIIKQTKKADVDLMLSGHAHDGQMVPLNLITRMIFGKYHTGFYKEGNFNINTSTGVGTWGPPLRTGNHPEIGVFTLK